MPNGGRVASKIVAKGMTTYTTPVNQPWRETGIALFGTPDPSGSVTSALIEFVEGSLVPKAYYEPAMNRIRLFFPSGDFLEVKAVLESAKSIMCFYAEQPLSDSVRAWLQAGP